MIETWKRIFEECNNKQKIIEARNKIIKEYINPLLSELKEAPKDKKKEIGERLSLLKKSLEEISEEYIAKFQKENVSIEPLTANDYNLLLKTQDKGGLNILSKTINEVKRFFSQFNFKFINGLEITEDLNNFQRLNIPKDHPARNMHDTFYFDEKILLRTHCTANTALYINNNNREDEIKVLSYGNVYRNDDDDATHSHQFMQIDFVWIKEGITLSNLKWLVDNFLKYFFGQEIKTRYRLSFFPFTEPSFEVDVSCFKCKDGCSLCKYTKWIEIMGAGMLHENVLKGANIVNKIGIAAGIGVERLIMLKYGISDIRELYANFWEILKQF